MDAEAIGGADERPRGGSGRRGARGALAMSALLALALAGEAAAQSRIDPDTGLGLVARDPVLATQRDVDDLCGRRTIPDENISFGDFTGDGLEDALILLDMPCQNNFSFCSPIGCSHRIWVGRDDGRFDYVNNIFASESRLTNFNGEPAIQFDNGPIWAFNGAEFEPVTDADGRLADDGFDDGGVRDDDFRDDDFRDDPIDEDEFDDFDDDPVVERFEGVWDFDVFGRGVGVASVMNRAGARVSLSCRRGAFNRSRAFIMRFLPPAFRDEQLPDSRGAGVLFDFVIDGRVADTRLMRRRQVGGPLVEPSVEARGPLVRRVRAGSTLIIREASGRPFGRFMLRGSSRAVRDLISYCSR